MTILVSDIMTKGTLVAYKTDTIAKVRHRMLKNGVRVLPVVDQHWEAVGIVTSGDLLLSPNAETPVSQVMPDTLHTISSDSGVHVAARIMRRNSAQYLVVTHKKKVVGILSVFDMLRLLENFQFEFKKIQPPSMRNSGVGRITTDSTSEYTSQ